MSLDPKPQNNAFVDTIAKLLLYKEIKRQKRFGLAYWPCQFLNNPYIASKNNSSLDISFYNIG